MPVSRCNVSVLFAHFSSARSALLVVMSEAAVGPGGAGTVRVIAAKGVCASSYAPLLQTQKMWHVRFHV